MSKRNGGWPRLPLEAMSDIELLMMFEDASDGDGGATAVQVAELTGEGIRAARSIGGRFSWLKRWGYMEQDEVDKRWFLTPEGVRLARGTLLTQTQSKQLERLAQSPLAVGEAIGLSLDINDRRMLRRQLRYREVHS